MKRIRKVVLGIALSILFVPTLVAQYANVEDITIESKELNQSREIMIYTPIGYEENEYNFFNVIYVFDSQNRMFFDFISSLATLNKGAESRGFIVVGIKATNIYEEVNGQRNYTYFRNLDLLPEDTDFFGGRFKGNSSAFFAYVKNEVMPYVESNYRVLPKKMAVGHSLSASFVLSAFARDPNLFDSYVAVSPSFNYDDERLLQELRAVNQERITSTKHIYVSHGDEGKSMGWQKSNEHAYPFLKDSLAGDKVKVILESHPDKGHLGNFVPSILSAMEVYQGEILPKWNSEISNESYEVTFRLKVLNEDDEIYLTGNQSPLANWATDEVKMEKESPLVREITLKVHDHVEVAFYKDGESQAWIKFGEGGRTSYPMMIKPEEGSVYEFEVDRYSN